MNLEAKEKDIAALVTKIYESPQAAHYPYHNLAHTESVVRHSKEMATHYLLNTTDRFILAVSSWFHDIGHLYGEWKDHEERGVRIMKQYTQDLPPDMTGTIGRCILITKLPSHPLTLLEEIICDADTYHLGTPFFRQTDVLVEKEMEIRTGKPFPDWHAKSLKFLQQHRYFTKYCRDRLDKGKEENITWLRQQVNQQSK
jgi:predicted metal-dependent HD superfamily phosphohydrolase